MPPATTIKSWPPGYHLRTVSCIFVTEDTGLLGSNIYPMTSPQVSKVLSWQVKTILPCRTSSFLVTQMHGQHSFKLPWALSCSLLISTLTYDALYLQSLPSKLFPNVPLGNPQSFQGLRYPRLLCPSLRLGTGFYHSRLPLCCVLCGVNSHFPRAKEHHEENMHRPKPSSSQSSAAELYPLPLLSFSPSPPSEDFFQAAFESSQ